MPAPKSLPARPSLESLRKQAGRLARDTAADDAAAIARARAQLPDVSLPLSRRDAQLVVAREYGYAGWQDLTGEVARRSGNGLAWAAAQAERAIHDDDAEALKRLLAEYPTLLSWELERGGLLALAAISYGDSFDPARERQFTRPRCVDLLLDAGTAVAPTVPDGVLATRAQEMLRLFQRRGLLPRTLRFLAALGDLDGVRACFDERGRFRPGAAGPGRPDERVTVEEGFMHACRNRQAPIAAFLFERCIALDPELGRRVDAWGGRAAFVEYMIKHGVRADDSDTEPYEPWRVFVMHRVIRAIQENDASELARLSHENPWVLGDECVPFQARLFEIAVLGDDPEFVDRLLALDLALLRRKPAPPARAIEFALAYGNARVMPQLLRIWPAPDHLPYAAGTGDMEGVKRWFDASGAPALGNPAHHLVAPGAGALSAHELTPPTVQRVLDTALAHACLNDHFEIADFLLAHGADINTRWNTHEPASILHELVFHRNYRAMQFLIDRGIDMTILDYRWRSTAEGWARYGAQDEEMARWLAEAEQRRARGGV
jgi:hypothetical protein